MKNTFYKSVLGTLLIIPAFNFAQFASNVDVDNSDNNVFLTSATSNVNVTSYVDAFNTTSIIKPYMRPTKLEGGVNSQYSEIGALISPDGKTLYFSRYQSPDNMGGKEDEEDIWYAEWNETTNSWGEAKNMGAPLNNKYPNYINSISPDGNTILLGNRYFENGKMGNGLSLSQRTSDGWSFPTEIKIDGTSKHTQWAGSNLSGKQNILLLAYQEEKNTVGERDLYVSFVKADKTWSKPVNLGKTVNTVGTESSPFLAADDSTLYFTSDGLNGYGGSDIYVTRRLDETWQHWSTPRNLGPVVNTESHQSFFSVSQGNIYFSSEADGDGNLDLYTLTLPENFKNSSEKTKPVAVVEDPKTTENNTTELNNSDLSSDISFSAVRFDFNKSDLKKETIYELNRIAKLLKESPASKLEVAGHTDNVGSHIYNQNLSQKRIDAIVYYFKNQSDIDKKRIVVINYGETKPVADNETPQGRMQNRRVEMTIKLKPLAD